MVLLQQAFRTPAQGSGEQMPPLINEPTQDPALRATAHVVLPQQAPPQGLVGEHTEPTAMNT